jgi:hypothetical protein
MSGLTALKEKYQKQTLDKQQILKDKSPNRDLRSGKSPLLPIKFSPSPRTSLI